MNITTESFPGSVEQGPCVRYSIFKDRPLRRFSGSSSAGVYDSDLLLLCQDPGETRLAAAEAHHRRDPADRTIVALAMRSASPLVSSDRMIRSFYAGVVW